MTDPEAGHPFGTDEWVAAARDELRAKPCYRCGAVGAMTLDWEARGTTRVLIMSHGGCGLRGRITEDRAHTNGTG